MDNLNKFNTKLELLDDMNKEAAQNYFMKGNTIEALFNIVRPTGDFKLESYGNYNSKVVYVIDFEKTNENYVEVLKLFHDANNFPFYNLFLTSYARTTNDKFNMALIQKQLDIIRPAKVIFIGVSCDPSKLNLQGATYYELTKFHKDTIERFYKMDTSCEEFVNNQSIYQSEKQALVSCIDFVIR